MKSGIRLKLTGNVSFKVATNGETLKKIKGHRLCFINAYAASSLQRDFIVLQASKKGICAPPAKERSCLCRQIQHEFHRGVYLLSEKCTRFLEKQ